MAQIATYDYQLHGGPTGYRNERAIVRLYGSDRQTVAYIHFVLTGNAIPPNKAADPWIRMYLPETLISDVMEMLRQESPVSIYYNQGQVFLHTGDEPVGEAE
jgi:hypothetical protein